MARVYVRSSLPTASHHFNNSYHPTVPLNSIEQDASTFQTSFYSALPSFSEGSRKRGLVTTGHVQVLQTRPQLLVGWLGTLPPGVGLDFPDLSQTLLSPKTDTASLIITRIPFYYIRITLHQPYAIGSDSERIRESRKIGIDSVEKPLALTKQMSPGYLDGNAQPSQAIHPSIRGHLNLRPFHVFSFRLIRDPDIPEAPGSGNIFTLSSLSSRVPGACRAIAKKSLQVFHTLAPSYSEVFSSLNERPQAGRKSSVLSVVGNLEFPY